MTTSETSPRLYDVWQLEFEFDDQPGIRKERPVIIGAVDDCTAAVLAVKVTGHGPRLGYPGEVRIEDWQVAGLAKPSVARCSKTLIVPFAAFSGKLRYGSLSERDSAAVAQALREIGTTI